MTVASGVMMSVFVSPVIAAITVGKEQHEDVTTCCTAHRDECKSVEGMIPPETERLRSGAKAAAYVNHLFDLNNKAVVLSKCLIPEGGIHADQKAFKDK